MADSFEPTEEVIAVVRKELVPLVDNVMSLASASKALAEEFKEQGIACKGSDLTQLAYRLSKEKK